MPDTKMKEFKSFGVVLSVAILLASFFVVIWVYNGISEHSNRINTLGAIVSSLSQHTQASQNDRDEIRGTVLDLTQLLKESQRNQRVGNSNVFASLQAIEAELKKNGGNFTLPDQKKVSKPKKKKKYESSSSEDEESGSDVDLDLELERRKRQKKRQNK